jgi:hypothetical protein
MRILSFSIYPLAFQNGKFYQIGRFCLSVLTFQNGKLKHTVKKQPSSKSPDIETTISYKYQTTNEVFV